MLAFRSSAYSWSWCSIPMCFRISCSYFWIWSSIAARFCWDVSDAYYSFITMLAWLAWPAWLAWLAWLAALFRYGELKRDVRF